MSNFTDSNTREEQCDELCKCLIKVFWLSGIATSCIGLLAQLCVVLLIPKCRKFDEKVLIQITINRTVNTICEYLFLVNKHFYNDFIKDLTMSLLMFTDFSLVCWMFIFTKNLFDKVVHVFTLKKWKFYIILICIGLVSVCVGSSCLFMLKMYPTQVFHYYYYTYCVIKFIICIINLFLFIGIFFIAITRGTNNRRQLRDILKTTIVAFTLVLTNSLQVFVTDVLSFVIGHNERLIRSFGVINSFQVIVINLIFFSLVKRKLRQPIIRTISLRLTEIM